MTNNSPKTNNSERSDKRNNILRKYQEGSEIDNFTLFLFLDL